MDITEQINEISMYYNKFLLGHTIFIVKHKEILFAKVEYLDLEYQDGVYQYVKKADWLELCV